MSTDEQTTLEGMVSVKAALEAKSRPIEALYLAQGKRSRSFSYLRRLAQSMDVPLHYVPRDDIDALASGRSHGGVLAISGPRRFVSLPSLVDSVDQPFIAMLDGIQDPFNFGAAVRALYAAGAHGLVVRPRNWMSAAAVVARSSAGASERMPTAVAETVFDAADFFHGLGLSIICTTKTQATSIYDTDLTMPLFLVIGGEKRGITRSFLDQADHRLEIPYGRAFSQSLGTASAVSIIAFEVMRQRSR